MEYIELEKALHIVDVISSDEGIKRKCKAIRKRLKELPGEDVEKVKHGEWLPDIETFVDDSERESEPIQTGWVCSLCGRQEFKKEPYCHCGAKMDGKEGAEE